ncbi:MAG: flagellar protein [Bacteroidales bacterium]|nr:flagellar protein [Clostridium sp.]MCM1202728.1 flagellar protein [Bacteroidales bacterium]
MERLQNSFMSIEQIKDTYLTNGKPENRQKTVTDQGLSFQQVLERASGAKDALQGVTFSKHANERLASRNINLDDAQLNRLNKGVMQAKEKSINESLVMMDNLAFIVNVKNNTVITAMDQDTNDSNVFTNIDGAVIV